MTAGLLPELKSDLRYVATVHPRRSILCLVNHWKDLSVDLIVK